MLLSKAIEGFNFSIRADGYSPSTVLLYMHDLKVLYEELDDPELDQITEGDLTHFFVYLREVYHKEMGREVLSGSTLQNYWKAIRTFFEWAKKQKLINIRPDQYLKMPPNNPKVVMPLKEDQVKALLHYAEYSRTSKPKNRKSFQTKRPEALRDTALLILLLDTGVRAGEAGRLVISDVDFENGLLLIRPYGSSRRKTKSRTIPLGKVSQRALWKYVSARKDARPDDPVFITRNERSMDKHTMFQLIKRLGENAGIKNCHPHRLRHTFAIEFLRNGGDIFTLKSILGHSSLEIVQNYLQIAATDVATAQRRASPADKWHL